ncbi:unnamed protein product [Angiostrongylus costaricensis]|uniref:Reverse transcriptase domain-containing protein n=1 Tax=Angiostrongylus costaricensis TaxID=334426 RepID=A0A0R3PZB6_ANGCS|nr:unnamed protein product [Angiostrongylus costaricensis]
MVRKVLHPNKRVAMGQRLAPNFAIAFMSKVEAPVTDLGPLLYCRYIDDRFVLCSTQEEMEKYGDRGNGDMCRGKAKPSDDDSSDNNVPFILSFISSELSAAIKREVSGMLRSEVTRLMDRLYNENDQLAVEIVPAGAITDDICEILSDKKWAELQTVIRDNLYSKTVPC